MPVKTFPRAGHEYKLPARHYSHRAQDALFFYGGDFSNFVGGPFEMRDYDGIMYLESTESLGVISRAEYEEAQRDPEVRKLLHDADEYLDAHLVIGYSYYKRIAQSTHLREYATIEHYFQANKATTRDDHDWIADAVGPWTAKKRGRGCVLRSDWEDVKFDVMMTALRVKFAQPPFRAALLGTHDRFIAEDSPTDFVWGIRDAQGGVSGDNLLGKALMLIRDELRAS
jgi:ribA/ribD-fused uncharacterized protein